MKRTATLLFCFLLFPSPSFGKSGDSIQQKAAARKERKLESVRCRALLNENIKRLKREQDALIKQADLEIKQLERNLWKCLREARRRRKKKFQRGVGEAKTKSIFLYYNYFPFLYFQGSPFSSPTPQN